jgi:hypothetical protein
MILDREFVKWLIQSLADQDSGKSAELENDYEIMREGFREHKRCSKDVLAF